MQSPHQHKKGEKFPLLQKEIPHSTFSNKICIEQSQELI